jgi:putative salt-induced outer membrane protein YdiY
MKKYLTVVAIVAAAMISSARAQEAAATEQKPLEASIALGVTFNDGNTENSMGTFDLGVVRRSDDVQTLRFDVDAAYGEEEGDKTTENAKAVLNYQYLVSERAYGVFNTSVEADDIAEVDYRSITSLGLGYYLMKNDAAFLTLDAGPAYVFEKKGGIEDEYAAVRAAQRYERVMTTNAKFWQSAEYTAQIDDFDVYVLEAEVGVEAPVSEKLSIRLAAKNTYDNNPAEGKEKNDVTVTGALAYSLF